MAISRSFAACLLLTSLLCFSTIAQPGNGETKRFAQDGLAFDYLSDSELVDSSESRQWHLTLTQRRSSIQITIIVKRDLTMLSELPSAMESFRESLLKTVLGQTAAKLQTSSIKSRVGEVDVEGVRLNGPIRTGTRVADVIWLRTKLRLVGLAFVRSAKEESTGSKLWELVRGSLTLEPPVVGAARDDSTNQAGLRIEAASVLNGRALALPHPPYPTIARVANASGTVAVQVLIDEFGNVRDALAISGPPVLFGVSVAAAREAKFTPTLLDGEAVRVTGVIQYNFIPQ